MIVLRREKDSPLTRDEVDNNFFELATKLNSAVNITEPQNISGLKAFTTSPTVPNLTLGDASTKAVNAKFVADTAASLIQTIQAIPTSDDTKLPLIGGTLTGDLIIDANLTVTGNITETSDIRLKHDIKPLNDSLDKVLKLQGVSFVKNGFEDTNIGFIAQNVLEVVPEVVKNDGQYLSVSYSNLVALLVEAIKEQEMRIQELENKLK